MDVFKPDRIDQLPIGTVVQSALNLERITNGKYVQMAGQDLNRSQYPEISPYFPAGVFTSTARTLNATPYGSTDPSIVTTSSYFVATGSQGTDCAQKSSDGITWTLLTSYFPASSIISSMVVRSDNSIVCAHRTVGAQPTIINSTMTGSIYTTGIGTPDETSTSYRSVAYSPQLGRTVLIGNTSSSKIWTLEDGATAWVGRSVTATTRNSVVWTGSRFIVFTSTSGYLQTSNDGITWADVYINSVGASGNVCATDGNGTIVTLLAGKYFNVSKDHGYTWRRALLPAEILDTNGLTNTAYSWNGPITFANGKFFVTSASNQPCVAISNDGLTWVMEPVGTRGMSYLSQGSAVFAYKSGVYCGIRAGVANAITATEDMSKFRVPGSLRDISNEMPAVYQEYMKVRM